MEAVLQLLTHSPLASRDITGTVQITVSIPSPLSAALPTYLRQEG